MKLYVYYMEGHWKIPNQVVIYTKKWLLVIIVKFRAE